MTIELLTREGDQSASPEQYVEAARLLTRLRDYRTRLDAALVRLGEATTFAEGWSPFSARHQQERVLGDLDAGHESIADQARRVEIILQDEMWAHIEDVVRRSAQAFQRNADSRGSEYCVLDFQGKWIVKGGRQLVKGTQLELEEAAERWTALSEVLPPRYPSALGAAMSPGPR